MATQRNPSSSATNTSAPLRQTTLNMTIKGRKRTLTLVNGGEVDLQTMKADDATPEVVEAMRLRILELENQLAADKPPAKRVKSGTAEQNTSSSAAASSSASGKVDERKRKVQLKKLFDQLKKECKADGVKFQGSPKTIKIEEVWEQAEFEALFSGKGTLIQPTPTNKPTSTVTIIEFNTKQQISDFFGSELKPLKGFAWTRGSGAPWFQKAVKIGARDVEVTSFNVSYSKNGLKGTVKFNVQEPGAGCANSDDDDW